MTSIESELECPICLMVFISPITLPCGHTYCEPCVKHTHFQHVKKKCPVCRQKLLLSVNFFSVNLILDKLIKQKYLKDEKYLARLKNVKKYESPNKVYQVAERVKSWLRNSYPWIIIFLLLYHLVRVKLNVFYMLMQKYKSKALSIAEEIKKQNSLDFKFLLFSQFMRILFSNIAIP